MTCIDKLLSRELVRPHLAVGDRAIAPIAKQWQAGTALSIAFIGGSETQRAQVRSIAPQWEQVCGIRFDWRTSLPATIRVAFDPSDGAWSYLGTDCAEIPANQPTMNLGWLDQAVILHEFGHALSLAHEHQNPLGGIQWNESEVIRDLSGPPNFWDEATIRHNVLNKYALNQIRGTDFDAQSIMLYSFPPSWTTNGFSAPWNTAISQADGVFTATLYPRTEAPPLVRLPLALARSAKLEPGAVHEYEFPAPVSGEYLFETAGMLDLVLSIYRGTSLIAQDDDSGRRANSRIEAQLTRGPYRVSVRGYNAAVSGTYRLIAWG